MSRFAARVDVLRFLVCEGHRGWSAVVGSDRDEIGADRDLGARVIWGDIAGWRVLTRTGVSSLMSLPGLKQEVRPITRARCAGKVHESVEARLGDWRSDGLHRFYTRGC